MTEAWVQSLFDEEPEVYGPSEKPKAHARTAKGVQAVARVGKSAERGGNWASLPELHETAGAPPLDWWNVSEEEVHRRLILAMCPERVCRTCGEPSRRIIQTDYVITRTGQPVPAGDGRFVSRPESNRTAIQRTGGDTPRIKAITGHDQSVTARNTTVGFSDCGHDDWRPGVVLDPFA